MKIDYLVEHQDFIPTLSKWFLREWRDFYGDKTWDIVAEVFYGRLNRRNIPLSLVAFEADYPLGTISLLEESISTYKHLSPWLGGLYVREERRKQGIGRYLIEAGVEQAGKLGAEQLYIGIRRAEDYYIRLGWQTIDRTFYHNEEITIMRIDSRPHEAKPARTGKNLSERRTSYDL
ncbi:MAG TPA: GNAT family N-acetyltransferase [Pyrinomonadaceae bacterium]|jgi:GNAT superfamily N-acetyltransferase